MHPAEQATNVSVAERPTMTPINAQPNEHEPSGPVSESELLLTRLIDGEASPDDRSRFETFAAADPSLWRRFAMRLEDMAILSARLDEELRHCDLIDLPAVAGIPAQFRKPFWRSLASISGWAAALALGVVWLASVDSTGRDERSGQPVADELAQPISYSDHLSRYLEAPFNSEVAPTLLQTERLPDGRTLIRYMRRIEEVGYLPPGESFELDQHQQPVLDPARLEFETSHRESN